MTYLFIYKTKCKTRLCILGMRSSFTTPFPFPVSCYTDKYFLNYGIRGNARFTHQINRIPSTTLYYRFPIFCSCPCKIPTTELSLPLFIHLINQPRTNERSRNFHHQLQATAPTAKHISPHPHQITTASLKKKARKKIKCQDRDLNPGISR